MNPQNKTQTNMENSKVDELVVINKTNTYYVSKNDWKCNKFLSF